ncbi:MAG: hypothetical protein V5A68_01580 [Candidatus Thermoplasmatota archaeon]
MNKNLTTITINQNKDNSKIKSSGRYAFDKSKSIKNKIENNFFIKEINTIEGLYEFYKIPYEIYPEDSFWVPPFWKIIKDFFKNENPFWNHAETKLFIAYKKSHPVGRIAAFIDHKYCKKIDKKIGFFGFFECIKDYKIASKLFKITEKWLKANNISIIQGPIDGRVDMGCGFLLKGFESPSTIMSPFSPKYYLSFCRRYGFQKNRDMMEFKIDLKKQLPRILKKSAEKSEKKDIKIKNFSKLRSKEFIDKWSKLFLDTFSKHWGFVPVSKKEVKYRFEVKYARLLADPKLFLIAELQKKPIAYIWATPDYNPVFRKMKGKIGLKQILQFIYFYKNIKRGKLHLIGCVKKHRNKKMANYLNYLVLKEMKKRKYEEATIGPVDENNSAARNILKKMDAEVYKKHRIFEKKIQKEKEGT